jgi:hypothetical protein
MNERRVWAAACDLRAAARNLGRNFRYGPLLIPLLLPQQVVHSKMGNK